MDAKRGERERALFGPWPISGRNLCLKKGVALFLVGVLASCSRIDDPSLFPEFDQVDHQPPAEKVAVPHNPLRDVYYGDLHIHTGFSTDAYVMGVRSRPEDVYRFAKGYAIEHAAGYPIQITRPLDFAAVTDHAEYLGQARQGDIQLPAVENSLRDILLGGNAFSITLAWLKTTLSVRGEGFALGSDGLDPVVFREAWSETVATAEKHYQPGAFTTFSGYEWSASVGDLTTHIHRVVIYRDNEVSDLPFSSLNSSRPEDLWQFLRSEEERGNVAIAIPHNGNQSKGNMYATGDSNGNPFSAEYAELRNYYEPVSEILQIKGASETHPLLSNLDEFAGYSIATMVPGQEDSLEQVKGSYARDALRVGMELSHSEGFNPYKFGFIGSSDSHNASSPSEESDYSGKLPMMDGSAGLRTSEVMLLPVELNPVTSWSSGGLAGVWAEENTRESIFNALRRKETFATSGPRLSVRMFAGWNLDSALLNDVNIIEKAYEQGVPMGADLPPITENDAVPQFFVLASKDPQGANLDRLQIIKGWVDAEGKSHEKIYNVAVSDEREVDEKGMVEPVGNTVDPDTATYENSIGEAQFLVHWQDPEFNSAREAFYYARVLEIPTPRWSTHDAVKLGSKPIAPHVIQERAIGSAIWYQPKSRNQ